MISETLVERLLPDVSRQIERDERESGSEASRLKPATMPTNDPGSADWQKD